MADENHKFFQLQEYDLNIFNIEDNLSQISIKLEEKLGIEDIRKKFNMIEESHAEISIEEFLPKEPTIQQKQINYDDFLLQNYSQKEQEIILFSKKYNL